MKLGIACKEGRGKNCSIRSLHNFILQEVYLTNATYWKHAAAGDLLLLRQSQAVHKSTNGQYVTGYRITMPLYQ